MPKFVFFQERYQLYFIFLPFVLCLGRKNASGYYKHSNETLPMPIVDRTAPLSRPGKEKWFQLYAVRFEYAWRNILLQKFNNFSSLVAYLPNDFILIALAEEHVPSALQMSGIVDLVVAPYTIKTQPNLINSTESLAVDLSYQNISNVNQTLPSKCPEYCLNVLLTQKISKKESRQLCFHRLANRSICSVRWNPSRKVIVCTTWCAKAQVVLLLAQKNAVLWIEERSALTLRNKYASRIAQSINASGHILWEKGLMGENEVKACTIPK